jgi:hypothetical protein
MIDRTNTAIEEREEEIRRENERRYGFYQNLHATDQVLWRLEELNRDGVGTIPGTERREFLRVLEDLPAECRELYDRGEVVQTVLDSLFEVQQCLFHRRDPQWSYDDDGDLERAS